MENVKADVPSYFFCGRHDVPKLVEKAESEAYSLLRELSAFIRGDIGIRIIPMHHVTCWSIGAWLTVNGELCREYESADLCFLEINELIMKRMIVSGAISSEGGAAS